MRRGREWQAGMETFQTIIEVIALGLEAVGVLAILIGFGVATARYAWRPEHLSSHAAYTAFRHGIGRAILVGLDFLIAGDIIKTVIVAESATSVAVLAAVVVIRTFISLTLHVEVEGRWPWQPAPAETATGTDGTDR